MSSSAQLKANKKPRADKLFKNAGWQHSSSMLMRESGFGLLLSATVLQSGIQI
jgi:hypothetical protein